MSRDAIEDAVYRRAGVSGPERMAITDDGIQLLAALELEQLAFELKRAHTHDGVWMQSIVEPNVKEEHDRLLWLAAQLRKIATQKP